jgi:hypothetical protein
VCPRIAVARRRKPGARDFARPTERAQQRREAVPPPDIYLLNKSTNYISSTFKFITEKKIMIKKKSKLAREEKTVSVMISLYCKGNRHFVGKELCPQCAELSVYSSERLEKCRYGEKKPTCRKCATHCYKPEYRDRVREVMRYAGPRMLSRHPVLALRHLLF